MSLSLDDGLCQVLPLPVEVDRHNPFIKPDWLWRIGTGSSASGLSGYPSQLWLQEVQAFCAKGDASSFAADTSPEAAALRSAIDIRDENGPLAWEIESRVLAGMTDAQIVDRTGLPALVVEAYVACFFDIRDRLTAQSWVYLNCLARRGDLLGERSVWCHGAYFIGAKLLDMLIDAYRSPEDSDPGDQQTAAQEWHDYMAIRYLAPACEAFRDAVVRLRDRYSAGDSRQDRLAMLYCDSLLIKGGWKPDLSGRLDDPDHVEKINQMSDEAFNDHLKTVAESVLEVRNYA